MNIIDIEDVQHIFNQVYFEADKNLRGKINVYSEGLRTYMDIFDRNGDIFYSAEITKDGNA